jgi:hypothetical protein
VRNGHFELALALVDAGADPNDQRTGFSPIHSVSWTRKPDASDTGNPSPVGSGNLTSLDSVRGMVERGADVDLTKSRLVKFPEPTGEGFPVSLASGLRVQLTL